MKSHLFQIKFFAFITLLLFICASCAQDPDPSGTLPDSSPVSYLALGDSYTIGTGIDTVSNYPHLLSDSLASRGFTVDTTAVIATNGWTTTDLKTGIDSQDPDSSYNLVSLLIGVNNQYQGLDLELYRTEFRELLDQAIAFAGGNRSNVFVISIPNYGVTPFGQSRNPVIIRQELQVYNDIAKEITTEFNIPFVDVTPISELGAEDSSLIAPDNLHPSAKMYAMWVDEMLPTVTQILDQND
ncbi:MAG: lysophospholipase [Balneola sp.]|nr:lysophospholipase [Balneola sp.]|tara:strand:- start:187914 stop:188636 length:723 start_codon:yes stop_codon:yes gene_type:complete